MSEWQSIETAPKDGTYILAWSPFGYGHVVVAFDDKATMPGWSWRTLNRTSYSLTTFTHWILLPEPPK